jgi:hypothetical protein
MKNWLYDWLEFLKSTASGGIQFLMPTVDTMIQRVDGDQPAVAAHNQPTS